MCHICDMQRNPDHETKLKILGFTKAMLVYKEKAEKFFKEQPELNTEAIAKMQNEEFDKIFKAHFQDTEDDQLLFHDLVTKTLWVFAMGDDIDVAAMEKDIQNDRANLN